MIFLIVFNPIIEYIQTFREKQGYQLSTETNAMFVNTTSFADDFKGGVTIFNMWTISPVGIGIGGKNVKKKLT